MNRQYSGFVSNVKFPEIKRPALDFLLNPTVKKLQCKRKSFCDTLSITKGLPRPKKYYVESPVKYDLDYFIALETPKKYVCFNGEDCDIDITFSLSTIAGITSNGQWVHNQKNEQFLMNGCRESM